MKHHDTHRRIMAELWMEHHDNGRIPWMKHHDIHVVNLK